MTRQWSASVCGQALLPPSPPALSSLLSFSGSLLTAPLRSLGQSYVWYSNSDNSNNIHDNVDDDINSDDNDNSNNN